MEPKTTTYGSTSSLNGFDQKAIDILTSILPGDSGSVTLNVDGTKVKYDSKCIEGTPGLNVAKPGTFIIIVNKNGFEIMREFYNNNTQHTARYYHVSKWDNCTEKQKEVQR